MTLQDYKQTLLDFGLEGLRARGDLQLTKDGNIAITRDGDLQWGDIRVNGMFRFIQRWRQSEAVINELFNSMIQATKNVETLKSVRASVKAPQLSQMPSAFNENSEHIEESRVIAAVLAGSIFVILNSLLQRLKKDLNACDDLWCQSKPTFGNYSLGQIFDAAAANFRHHDEWAAKKFPSKQQLCSMSVLSSVLSISLHKRSESHIIRTNVCDEILMQVTEGSIENLRLLTVGYAKSLSRIV